MAIIGLRSTNPEFSYIIRKNPESGMLIRSIRKGLGFGWYLDAQCFNVYFKDADTEVSYKREKDEQFEYLNISRYNTPLFVINAISEFFASAFKEKHECDVKGYQHSFFINMIHIDRLRYLEIFQRHFPNVMFIYDNLAHKSYKLEISTTENVYYLIHMVNVFCIFMAMFAPEYLDISDASLEKAIRSIKVIDAPFYIRSLFVVNFLKSRSNFNKYKSSLEETDRYEIEFAFGDTAMQRRELIREQLAFDKPILDIGCGEGYYAVPFAAKLDHHHYYAIDIDPDILAVVEKKASRCDIENLLLFSSFNAFLETYNGEIVDVILTEVIEHMPLNQARILIEKILEAIHFDTFIVTTPNADFNQFYEIANKFRHDGHDWEMGKTDFFVWVVDILNNYSCCYEFVAIGDKVNGISTSQGFIVKNGHTLKKGEQ